MTFRAAFVGEHDLSRHQLLTEVRIERKIYDHSRAFLSLEWDELEPYAKRDTAVIAARLLGCKVQITWEGDALAQCVPCFHGYVERVAGEIRAGKSCLAIECITESKRTDLVPRYRAFQETTLKAICEQIAQTEPLFRIKDDTQLDIKIPLSLQYHETDYEYVQRMLHAHAVPLAIKEETGAIHLGARGWEYQKAFPEPNWHWQSIRFGGALEAYPKYAEGGNRATLTARKRLADFNKQLKPKARDYFTVPIKEKIRDAVSSTNSQLDTTNYTLLTDGLVLPFAPGDIVPFAAHDHLIREVRIHGRPQESYVSQELVLQAFTLPLTPERRVPAWPSRLVWGHVTENEFDPTFSGRIQVKFEWEDLDPHASNDRVWLPMVTPYGGGTSMGKGKAGAYNGFHSVPEKGERVIVEFLGDWDSDALVMGTVREKGVKQSHNPKETKRWRTPSGNEVVMTTQGGTDILTMKTQDKLCFQSKVEGGTAQIHITPGESAGDYIDFKIGSGPPTLTVMCGGFINMTAQQSINLTAMESINMVAPDINVSAAKNLNMMAGQMANLSSGIYLGLQGLVVTNLSGAAVKINGGIIRMDGKKVDINS